jgi:hypothetical protein
MCRDLRQRTNKRDPGRRPRRVVRGISGVDRSGVRALRCRDRERRAESFRIRFRFARLRHVFEVQQVSTNMRRNGQATARLGPSVETSLLQVDAGMVGKTVWLFVEKIGALLPCPLHSYLRIHGSDRKNNCLWRNTLRIYCNALAFVLIVGRGGTGDRHLDSSAIWERAGPNLPSHESAAAFAAPVRSAGAAANRSPSVSLRFKRIMSCPFPELSTGRQRR